MTEVGHLWEHSLPKDNSNELSGPCPPRSLCLTFRYVSTTFRYVWETRFKLEVPGPSTRWPQIKGSKHVRLLGSIFGHPFAHLLESRDLRTPWFHLLRVALRSVTFHIKRLRFVTFQITFRDVSLRETPISDVDSRFFIF